MGDGASRATSVVNLTVEPATGVRVTIKATDVTLEFGELIEGILDDRDHVFLVLVWDVIFGRLGLLDLSGDDSLDREENE